MNKPSLPDNNQCSIAVLGLGYVGLPVAYAFATTKYSIESSISLSRDIVAFDINPKRIQELREGLDRTNELTDIQMKELLQSSIKFTNDASQLDCADVFIVTVPTPIDSSKKPNLEPLKKASRIVGQSIKKRSLVSSLRSTLPIIVYESTVFPGATEEICIPILEKESQLVCNKDFYVGYSPERLVPGDKSHSFKNTLKVQADLQMNLVSGLIPCIDLLSRQVLIAPLV